MHGWLWWNEIRRIMGWDGPDSFGYLFQSGSGATLELGAWGTLLWYWRTSCQARRFCLRHAKHDWTDPQTGLTHKLCWVHHPDAASKYIGKIRGLRRKSHLYLGSQPGRDPQEEQRAP